MKYLTFIATMILGLLWSCEKPKPPVIDPITIECTEREDIDDWNPFLLKNGYQISFPNDYFDSLSLFHSQNQQLTSDSIWFFFFCFTYAIIDGPYECDYEYNYLDSIIGTSTENVRYYKGDEESPLNYTLQLCEEDEVIAYLYLETNENKSKSGRLYLRFRDEEIFHYAANVGFNNDNEDLFMKILKTLKR